MNEEEQADFIKKYAGWYDKRKYYPIFQIPGTPWHVDANWREGYLGAAQVIAKGVVDGTLRPAIEGVAGVFLFRHYLELALKHIVWHARWLETAKKNAALEDITPLHRNHSLMAWWNLVKGEARKKMPQAEWEAMDVEFVEECVKEFEAVDPDPAWRFRYHGQYFAIAKHVLEGTGYPMEPTKDLYIDFNALAAQMEHVYDVLNAIDVYLIETHGQNQEWEVEMNAW
jgi:hypothetical protein